MEEIRWNFLVLWMKDQRDFWNVVLKSRRNLMYNCSEQRSMRLNLKKVVFTTSFNAYEHSTSQWSNSCTRPIIIFPNTTPSWSSERHSPSCRAGWCSCRGSGARCERACCPQRRRAAKREASSSPAKYVCVGICIFHRICIFHFICIWVWNLDLWFPLPLVWKITVGPELDCSSLRKSRVRISLQLDLKMRQFVMIRDCFLENMTTHDNMRLFTGKHSNKQMNSDLL